MSAPHSAAMLRVGNDVVDLEVPRMRGKASDVRFVERILAPEEREVVAAADDPDLELWSIWAAKEAAYKVVSKLLGDPPHFVHRSFVVGFTTRVADPATPVRRTGAVRYGERAIPVTVERQPTVVRAWASWDQRADTPCVPAEGSRAFTHTLASLDEPHARWTLPDRELRALLTERELEPVHSRESAAVRVAAKADLSSALGVPEERVQIMCGEGPKGRRPPYVLIDGEPGQVDVSLSHHGSWIAWAIWTGAIGEATFTG